MERSQAIARSGQLKTAVLTIASRVWSLTDIAPPYYTAEGRMGAKKVAADGRRLVFVNGAWVSVDETTFGLLFVGERLRVRYTRRARAISIDRIVDGG